MSEITKIELSKDLIEPIVRAQLQASIVSAMGRADQLVAQVVNTVMNSKVDNSGNPERYSGGIPLITWMANSAIKEAAMEAIKEWFAGNKDEMKKHLKAAIQKNAKGMAEDFVLGMSQAATSSYNTTVEVKIGDKRRKE